MDLYSPVTELKGIKAVRAAQLQKLGIKTLYDLIAYFPRDYEDRTRIVPISELEPDRPACFEAMVISSPRTAHIRKGLTLTKVQVGDLTGRLNLTFFNQPYVASNLKYGESYRFFGTMQSDFGASMQNPVFEAVSQCGRTTGRLFPIYGLTAGLSNQTVIRSVEQALDACADSLCDFLPPSVREQYGLCDVAFAYRTIHAPQNAEMLSIARRRIVFEEFFTLAAGLQILRKDRTFHEGAVLDCGMLGDFLSALPFSLTGAQMRVIRQIEKDFMSGRPMNRLVQGDVGSGKTMVAAAAAFLAAKNGHQTALMAPTEILAEQHFASLRPLFERFGIRCALLTGSMKAAEKRAVKEAIADGSAAIVIGTHALLTADVDFQKLGLIIADEQHRFGVSQRAVLAAKGKSPHLLVMSATPIPRTLALIAYGELDVSVIDELPPGRQKIDTFLVNETYRRRLNAFIEKQCAEGGQVYIVCPAVEESETLSLKSAESWAQTLQSAVFPNLRVGLLHGQMKGAEKDAVMKAFSRHEIDILVSTTVIEVGVDVPNANLMVIENAERFGLSQLHQLRGRVGRGSRKSYCVLISSNQNPQTRERLDALCQSGDGFVIAQKDLDLRGPGDFFGSRQHGLPMLKVASLQMDVKTLEQAQQAANDALGDAQWLKSPEYAALRDRMSALFAEDPIALN